MGKVPSKDLYLCGSGLGTKIGEGEVSFPLDLPRFEVGSFVILKVEFQQIALSKGIGYGWGI